MGLIFFELGEHEEAIRSFELIPPDTKFLDEAVFYRAQAEARRSRPQAAVDLLRPLVERNPGDITFLFEFGRSLLMARRYQEAIPVFIRAIEFAPKMQDLHLGLAQAYLAVNDFKNAITYLETVNRMSPADENVQMLLNVARGRLNISARIDDFIKYVEARPGDVKNRVDLVHALAFLGRIAEAEKYITEIYALDPSDPEVYHMIGVAYGEADDDEKALAAYRRALQKGENAAPYLGIAGIMMQRGNVEESSKAFDKVLELKPDAPDIMAGYAKMLRENGKRRESLAMYRRSLAIKPMNGNALFHACVLSLKLGEPDAANTYLQQLRVADPQMADVLARGMKLRIWN
jgi:tetratricopeptide (TPR) repeat protein